MSHDFNPGDVFHTNQTNPYNRNFYLIYNKHEKQYGTSYSVVNIFSFHHRDGFAVLPTQGRDLFSKLYARDELHLFPIIIKDLMETRGIQVLKKYNISLAATSYSTYYEGIMLKPYPLNVYPKELHQWSTYFLHPTKVSSLKNVGPIIHLD